MKEWDGMDGMDGMDGWEGTQGRGGRETVVPRLFYLAPIDACMLRLFYGCSYMYRLSGNSSRDRHIKGS